MHSAVVCTNYQTRRLQYKTMCVSATTFQNMFLYISIYPGRDIYQLAKIYLNIMVKVLGAQTTTTLLKIYIYINFASCTVFLLEALESL